MPVFLLELRENEVFQRDCDAVSLVEAALSEPPRAAYLVARTWSGGKVLDLDGHFDRLERSAAALGVEATVPRRRLREVLAAAAVDQEIRFRITLMPGAGEGVDGARDAASDAASGSAGGSAPWYRITCEPATTVAPELLERGVSCAVQPGAAREDAAVKSTEWMHRRRGLATGAQVYEVLLADEAGRILEGATSNFYAVLRGSLRTAGAGVLSGIARKIVLAVAPEIVPVVLDPITVDELPQIEEAFITSATRGVVPVRTIGEVTLPGSGPGQITRAISDAYNSWLQDHLEPLF